LRYEQPGEIDMATAEVRSDVAIREDVLLELKWDPKIKSDDIAVAVKEGVVTLSGFVSSYWELDAAEKTAKRVYGVNSNFRKSLLNQQ
jgi:osmotically-inducible protein OsmY